MKTSVHATFVLILFAGKSVRIDATLADAPLYKHWKGGLLW